MKPCLNKSKQKAKQQSQRGLAFLQGLLLNSRDNCLLPPGSCSCKESVLEYKVPKPKVAFLPPSYPNQLASSQCKLLLIKVLYWLGQDDDCGSVFPFTAGLSDLHQCETGALGYIPFSVGMPGSCGAQAHVSLGRKW